MPCIAYGICMFSYPIHIPAIVSIWSLVVIVLCGEGLVMMKYRLIPKIVLLSVVASGLIVSIKYMIGTPYARRLYASGCLQGFCIILERLRRLLKSMVSFMKG